MFDWSNVSRAAAFAKWLPAHANLVNWINLDLDSTWRNGPEDSVAAHSVIDAMIGLSLRQATAAANSSSTAAAYPYRERQQQQRPQFALQSFCSRVRHSVEVLSALPAATLTSLTCSFPWTDNENETVELSQFQQCGLADLTNLRHLNLDSHFVGEECLSAIGELDQLTELEIDQISMCLNDLRYLPASLEQLHLPAVYVDVRVEDAGDAEDTDAAPAMQQLDLRHLTRLTQLRLELYDSSTPLREMRINGQLPQQLLELHASAEGCAVVPLLGITALEQLQQLEVDNSCDSEEGLVALNGLTTLTNIYLCFTGALAAAPTSRSWGRLSQLRSLRISGKQEDVETDDGSSFQQVMQGLAAATSLRELHLDFVESVTAEGLQPKLFGFLTGLKQLKALHVECRRFGGDAAATEAYDAMQLTALTGLTKLEIIAWNVEDAGQLRWHATCQSCGFCS
jgi:hypothetical protein